MINDVQLFAKCMLWSIAIAILIVNVIRAIWEMIKWKRREKSRMRNCDDCIHKAVCYRYSYGLPENYADKCGDYLPKPYEPQESEDKE